MFQEYDVIVVGGGHAGSEAAAAAANTGSKVLMVTMNMQTIGQMSCNPAMGGVAKGQIIREIDALGGYSGIVTDETMIQFRMLNRSKGPAMWSPRAQSDRMDFAAKWRQMLEDTPNIDFWQDMVRELIVEDSTIKGVITGMGMRIMAKAVILTSGTFLNGLIHIGDKNFGGGRMGEAASGGITEQLIELGFEHGRMKTGTPPRVDGRSLNYDRMEIQDGDEEPSKFSYTDTKPLGKQRPCYVTYTNREVHDLLKTGFDQSPMFNGRIQGVGPRYCPSIEDKIDRFADRERHQLFVEPEGWNTVEIYVNGFSTSLPEEIQYEAMKKIPGFENVKMFRPGYAIEYDYFPPTQLDNTLQTRIIRGLFFAGQINGTTGYEEAACQGIVAGINASSYIKEEKYLILSRSEAYIGVLIDDLITKGTQEPYRMFTSRAEFRIMLRQDNADFRLTPIGNEIGLASQDRLDQVRKKEDEVEAIQKLFKKTSVTPDQINSLLNSLESKELSQSVKLEKVLVRPNVSLKEMMQHLPKVSAELEQYLPESLEQAEIQLKYSGYIQKEKEQVEKMSRLEGLELSKDFDYEKVQSLSNEGREKLNSLKPNNIGQASRISGVSASDISVLMVYLGR